MTELKIYVTFNVPDDFYSDENYDNNMNYIDEVLQQMADGMGGSIHDVEVK